MSTIRLHAPASGMNNSITVNGRTYTTTPGTPIDVPDFDAFVMLANGWTAIDVGAGVGATALRPNPANKGVTFLDTTIGAHIQYDGKTWRNPITGATV
jgi:hypothetical protein